MIEWIVIFRPSNVCEEINMFLRAFLEKLPGRCQIDVNQSSKYFKKTSCSQPNQSSLTEVTGSRNGFLLNSCDRMLRMFIISKKLLLTSKTLQYQQLQDVVNVLLTVELHTWAANLTFIIEYGVDFISESEVFQINWNLVATGVHCYMLIATLMFIFSKIFSSIFFGLIWSQNLKFFKLTEIWYRDSLPYTYFDFNVFFSKFLSFIFSLGKFGPTKSEVCQIKWNLVQGYIVYAYFDFSVYFFKFLSIHIHIFLSFIYWSSSNWQKFGT